MPENDKIKDYVISRFPLYGINKRNEITRLLYEIAKREKIPPESIQWIIPPGERDFEKIKSVLLRRRYPSLDIASGVKFYLPKLDVSSRANVDLARRPAVKNVFYEDAVSESRILARFREYFPKAEFKRIATYKEYIQGRKFSLDDYNRRAESLYVVRERYDFLKKCPCTAKALACAYRVLNLGMGCVFECSYCYLQEYMDSSGILVPANLEDFFSAFSRSPIAGRLGTGEFTDSLAFDHITGFSGLLIDFFRRYPRALFEFKTKSDNVTGILSVQAADNIVVSWSLNPPAVIARNEFFSSPLSDRIFAASRCAASGFKVGFHFDPVILYDGWERDYRCLVEGVLDAVPEKAIAWISIGTLRFSRRLKRIVENRFPENSILDGELVPGFDGKMRYPSKLRVAVYSSMLEWLRARGGRFPVYLCMEEEDVWRSCGMRMPVFCA